MEKNVYGNEPPQEAQLLEECICNSFRKSPSNAASIALEASLMNQSHTNWANTASVEEKPLLTKNKKNPTIFPPKDILLFPKTSENILWTVEKTSVCTLHLIQKKKTQPEIMWGTGASGPEWLKSYILPSIRKPWFWWSVYHSEFFTYAHVVVDGFSPSIHWKLTNTRFLKRILTP